VRQWQQHTSGDFSLTVLPGDHAFIYDPDAVELLIDELSAALSPQPATRARRPARRSMTSFG
jgi:surfactin synthase thioesterase subunit